MERQWRRRPRRDEIGGVVVVVPVHDEEEHLARCLNSIHRAVAHPALRGLPTSVVVVLDGCRDGSATIARRLRRRGDVIVAIEEQSVGAARAVGSREGLAALGLPQANVWLAHTDADTSVPPHWLARQLSLATRFDAVAGVVRVRDWTSHLPTTRRRFERDYRGSWLTSAHPHVHGANLGVRASAYLEVGGFPPLACSEDHALWDALGTGGHPVVATRHLWVTTSARREARAEGGFADTLLALERDLELRPLGPRFAVPMRFPRFVFAQGDR